MKRTSVDRARSFKGVQIEIFDFALEDVVKEARERFIQDAEAIGGLLDLPDSVSDYMEELSAYYDTEITSQLQRDISQASMSLNEFALEIFMQRQQPFVSNQDAHIKALIDTSEQIRFFFKDRSGRKLVSQKFIKRVTRHTLLLAALHAYAIEAFMAGADHMVITHPENANVAGQKIGFLREQGFPIIADLRDEVFHPNSQAFVKVVF